MKTECDLDFMFKDQGHSANALKSRYLANYYVDFDMYPHIINHAGQNITFLFLVKCQKS